MQGYCSFVLAILSVCLLSLNAAPSLQKCKKEDGQCLKELVQGMINTVAVGDPKYGWDPLDPMYIQHIDSSSSSLQLNLQDVIVTGLRGCVAKKVRYSPERTSLFMKLMCSIEMNGQYEMKGRLLFLPIEGNGKNHVILRKAIFGVDSVLSKVNGADGKEHLKIVDWTHDYDLKDKAEVHFDNLFNGNEILGKAAQEVIENNSNEIVQEVGGPIVKTIVTNVVEAVQKIYDVIPLEDLIIDT
ncbi:uncharacterized protein LOC121733810 isoform X2 [Aricia agestis]|uniref:uncharacterized protein LOC121733810 isoform X2 n=1 Tax=Aricia agestis TaxID=91739 RepID=UPI001C2060FA|nr:uncharacterized protein LOC121733810 isoform X2 [Aricia agestis]